MIQSGGEVLVRSGLDQAANRDFHRSFVVDHIVSRGGFGVPTLVVRDQPIFGPVITPAPTGEQGVDLWRVTHASGMRIF